MGSLFGEHRPLGENWPYRGEHRTEVTEGDGSGGFAFWSTQGLSATTSRIGKSIAQRSRRSQRGMGVADSLFGEHEPLGENRPYRGEHPTEVTEGGCGWWVCNS